MEPNRTRLPLSELEKLPEYQRLTPKQRLFVATYCEGGLADGNYDAVTATRVAYNCKSIETARVMSYSMLTNVRIIAVLNRHFGLEPIEEFLVSLDRAINNKKLTQAQLGALKLKSDILGLANRLPYLHEGATQLPVKAAKAAKAEKTQKIKKPAKEPTVSSEGYGD